MIGAHCSSAHRSGESHLYPPHAGAGSVNGFVSGLGAALGDGCLRDHHRFRLYGHRAVVHGFSGTLELIGRRAADHLRHQHLFFGPAARPRVEQATPRQVGAPSLARAFASTFALTITNPATLFGFATLFATLGGLSGATPASSARASSCSAWSRLDAVVVHAHHHRRLLPRQDRCIGHEVDQSLSGGLVAVCGVVVLLHLIFRR